MLIEAYNPDGSAATGSDFLNYTTYAASSTFSIHQNYGVFPLGTPPATAQIGSEPSQVNRNGLQYTAFAVPPNQPLYFTCLWRAQAIGTVFMRADNEGKGYALSDNQTQTLQIPYEFALSEYTTASQLVSQYSASGFSFSAAARALLLQSSAAVSNATLSTRPADRAIASYAALAIIMPLKERLVLEISNASISRAAPRQDFVLNYEGFGDWTSSSTIANYNRAKKVGFTFVLTACDWKTISPSQGVYDFSTLDSQIDQALALGYEVSISVNQSINSMPLWVQKLSFEELKTLYYQNAQKFVARYKDKIASIYPIAEIELATHGHSLDQIAELARQSFEGARTAAPSMPFGIYLSASAYVGYVWGARNNGCDCFSSLDLVSYLAKSNIKADYLGLEMQHSTVFAPLDLQRVYELLLTYHNTIDLPIYIGETAYSSKSEDYGISAPFYWHGGLTEAAQAEWADGFLRIAYGLPFVKGLNWVHLAVDDNDNGEAFLSTLVGTSVFRSDGSPKPSYFTFQNFVNTVLLSQHNDFAPVCTSQTPSGDFGAVGGSAIEFTVAAQDSDDNSLTFTWSVDGFVVTDAIGPSYYWMLPRNASGAHLVSLLVSDGFHATQTIWRVDAVLGKKPTILFDETHSERNTISPERATQMNPQHPEYVSFGKLASYLSQSYQVSSLASGALTPAALSGVDVLVLAAPDAALSAAENQVVMQFVQSGGGLIYMGDAWLNRSNNTLLATWGIQFDPGMILSPSASAGCPGCFPLKAFTDHPALGKNPTFVVGNAGSLAISGQAASLGQTGVAEWRSNSIQPPQRPGEPNGPFTMIAVSGGGAGKVFALSDNGFYDQFFDAYPYNVALLSSALAWLTSGGTIKTVPLISTGGVVNGASFANGAALAPGTIFSVFGTHLFEPGHNSVEMRSTVLPLSANLGGTQVLLDGQPAPLFYVNDTQINAQMPWTVVPGTRVKVVVRRNGVFSTEEPLQIAGTSPGVFCYDGFGYDRIAIITHADYTLVTPDKPLRREEKFILWWTGGGYPDGAAPALGDASQTALRTFNPVRLVLGGRSITIDYAGLSPGSVGLYQLNGTVPADLEADKATLVGTLQTADTTDAVRTFVAH